MNDSGKHITVLKTEAVEALALQPDATVVDATLGSGGHAGEMLRKLNEAGTFVGLDADPAAIADAKETLKGRATLHLLNRNFRELGSILDKLGIEKADAILADLGWRTEQFTEGGRGFSFEADEPLLMTYGHPGDYPFTAKTIVNEWSEESVANVLKGYGEERYAKRIAKAIVAARESKPIQTSAELAEVVVHTVPGQYRRGRIHPATRTFQALRIAVNDELKTLEVFIDEALKHLAPEGRLAIISFHSLEDRIVKHAFREHEREGEGSVLTKKPIVATKEEVAKNPRARSAKLRVFEKL